MKETKAPTKVEFAKDKGIAAIWKVARDNGYLFKVPKLFYDDHVARELPAPTVIRENKTHYWISLGGAHIDEFISDAEYYSFYEGMGREYHGIVASARATLRAYEKAKPNFLKGA
jgi:hypothetical protein|tara:strand:+ start:247 stop:591 length:345 start_codon:yes stop_codon:yes gene_type:complete